ncbi:MAG: DNA glycosylase [Candidatus Bathyarchaeia archaeon]|nr:DNA glycosylase [Candidatus Bathyarchaeia archaeon]
MEIQLSNFYPLDLDFTLGCGQAFKWNKHGEWWYGVVKEKVFKIRQVDNKLEFENVDADFIKDYFGLHDNLPKIFSQITKDRHVEAAIKKFKGLRILRQNPWECLISYVCATYKNIPAIKQMLLNLSKKFGDKTAFNGYYFYTVPTPAKLAKASTKELAECGLGYRARYVSETATIIYEGNVDFESLRKTSYEEARKELLTLRGHGVGLKVADCVLLFSIGKLEAFPVDVWIKRVILKHYANHFPSEFIRKISAKKSLANSEYERLNLFGRRYFGEYAGYAQEYLYQFERTQR